MDENFLQSPLPLINRIRLWIYGKESPKLYLKISYSVNSVLALLFFIWHLLGFSAVFFRKFVFTKKQIAVDEIIKLNAHKLGCTFEELISYLQIHHLISAAVWVMILWVLVLFWRGSKKIYLYILFLLLAYFIQGIYFFGWRFITDELTFFDWMMLVLFCVLFLVSGIIQVFFIKTKSRSEINEVIQ